MTEPVALKALESAARMWMEYVETHGGDYLPEHTQWIKAAIQAVDRARADTTRNAHQLDKNGQCPKCWGEEAQDDSQAGANTGVIPEKDRNRG